MKNKALSIEQVATVCGVSKERVKRWIEKRGLKTDPTTKDGEFVQHTDMIDFFVKFNMPIPESIMPFKANKILFIYTSNSENRHFMAFLIGFLGKLRLENSNFIADHITYGPDAKIKVMVFKPDVIMLDMTENDIDAIDLCIKMKNTEELNSIKLVAITCESLIDEYLHKAKHCGIDEIFSHSINIDSYAKKILSFNEIK